MRHSVLSSVASATAVALLMTGTTAAHADDFDDELTSTVVEAAAFAGTQPGETRALNLGSGDATAQTEGALVTVPLDPSSPLTVANAGGGDAPVLTIGLPENATGSTDGELEDPNSVAFEGDDAHFVVQTFDEGVRIATVIENADAARSYTYDLPADVTPVLNADGSVTLTTTFAGDGGDFVTIQYGTVDAPWAVDANGNAVSTRYEVADGKLTQVVEHSTANSYPVTADPTYWWGWNMFISNSVHKKVVDAWASGVTAVGIANLFVSYIPNAYAQLAVRLASAMFAAGFLSFKVCNARGKGVILGQVTVLNWLPPIGPFGFVRSGFFCMPQ